MGFALYTGDCREVMPKRGMINLADAVVTDPPYGLEFMGKGWDKGVPGVEFWEAVMGAMKPGAHLLAFGGTRTFHRLTCAIEDAGFEIRDCVMWVYGSGFPKSLNVSKAIDKAAGAKRKLVGLRLQKRPLPLPLIVPGEEIVLAITAPSTDAAKQWDGFGTALKPAWEPILLARKPLEGTVANNVLEYGVGGLNIDACRVGADLVGWGGAGGFKNTHDASGRSGPLIDGEPRPVSGRWPANLIHDGSDEVVELFPDSNSNKPDNHRTPIDDGGNYGSSRKSGLGGHGDSGSAARFFYCAKASKSERDMGLQDTEPHTAGDMTGGRKEGSDGLNSPRAGAGRTSGGHNNHPTVKPLALMRYLCRLITPPNGLILDPFMGSGSTLIAATLEGFHSIGIDTEPSYVAITQQRLREVKMPPRD